MDKGQILATAVLAAGTFIKALPQTIGLSKYKEFLQFYNGTEPQPLDNKTKELLEMCLYKIDMEPYLETGFEAFVAYGQDVVHKGSLHIRTGAIVGVPFHFRYQEKSDIDKNRLTLKNVSIDWNSEEGEKFADSLILSDNAKKFAIAREIYYVLGHHINIDCGLMILNFGAGYCGYYALRELYQLKHRIRLFSRMTILGAFGMAAMGTYSFMSDVFQRRRDKNALMKTSQLGNDFVEGGIEFYTKLLQRNSALYHLLGKDGEKCYTLCGNERISFRMKHLPITFQRDMLKEILAKNELKLK